MVGISIDTMGQVIFSINIQQKKGETTINGNPSADISGSLLKSIEQQSGLTF